MSINELTNLLNLEFLKLYEGIAYNNTISLGILSVIK